MIMGLTFKEDCSDIRNSKVIDIINRLKEYDIQPIVTDSYANPVSVKNEYGIALTPFEDMPKADCVIVAVGHKEYRDMSVMRIKDMFKGDLHDSQKVLVDLKSLYPLKELKASGMRFWRL